VLGVDLADLASLRRLELVASGRGEAEQPGLEGDKAGAALTGFVTGALTKATGAHADVQDWYAWFLQNLVLRHAALWSYLVSWG
jgi:thiosulfate dehydrogenase (quinone) large subunit